MLHLHNYYGLFPLYIFSVTKQHEHEHEYFTTKPLPTQIRVKELVSNDDDMVMDANPAYVEGFPSANKVTEAGDDGEYEIVENPFRQTKKADVIVKNPAYVD